MSRWRVVLVLALIVLPFLFMAAAGSYFLWREGLSTYVLWPLTGCMILGYGLGWHWQRKKRLLRPIDFEPPIHWTTQDQQAWRLVQARAETGTSMSLDQLGDFGCYVDVAQDMAIELARFYHPGAKDPLGSLTIPEILATIELAAHDLAEMADQYLPAGHLLTVDHWRQAKKAKDWYPALSNAYWAVSALFSPVNTSLRYVAAQFGMTRPWQILQQNLVAWFYTAFVYKVGTYLIDLNSGRLRVGAQRYRELIRSRSGVDGQAFSAGVDQAIPHITLTVLGQVKAGKSSLINALLGEQQAKTDVLPATREITRYELQTEGIATRLVLLDTTGYGHTGPREDQLRATAEAAKDSDLLFLVVNARSAARQADLDMLKKLRGWFADQPHLKMPPVVAVMTHIDLLSPAMEWAPPYNWLEPKRPKEEQISQALIALQEQLGEYLAGAVPVCAAPGKVYGVEEWLLPTMVEWLEEAHAVALLRCLHREIDARKARKVFQQLLATGTQAAKVLLENYLKKNASAR